MLVGCCTYRKGVRTKLSSDAPTTSDVPEKEGSPVVVLVKSHKMLLVSSHIAYKSESDSNT